MKNDAPPYDPYDQPPPWWTHHVDALYTLAVFVATIVLTVIAFPPYKVPEFAYAFAAPALFWAYERPRFKRFAFTVLGANGVAWTIILGWLHHVTWLGLFLLGPVVGVWVGSWYLIAWWAMPRMLGRNALERILSVFGLAGAWVVIEWTRTWLLSGFPWLPLAASQWDRVTILQIAAYTGAWGVSFVLIAMNIGFAAYAHRLLREGKSGLQRRSQEFFACLFLLIVCVTVHVQETFNRGQFTVPLGRISFVQPNIPQDIKWDASKGPHILRVLERGTLVAGRAYPDLILWPEASTPWAVRGDPQVKSWIESLVRRAGHPLLLGSIGIDHPGTPKEAWYNGIFLVTPQQGLQPEFYAKRHLVPFGEYVPFRSVLGWLNKVVPVGGDFTPGKGPRTLLVPFPQGDIPFGSLVCYEDIFPDLAVQDVRAGAQVLFVASNSGWYGKSSEAMQQMTHSVLRAVETRRPVLRCGNNGWSGWIDEFGNVRGYVHNEAGSIFLRADATLNVTRDSRWIGRESFYVKHGDWFVLLSAGLATLAYALLRMERKPKPAADAAAEDDASNAP